MPDMELGGQTKKYIVLKWDTTLKGALAEHHARKGDTEHMKLLVELCGLVESRLPKEDKTYE